MSEQGFWPEELKMGHVEWKRMVAERRAQGTISESMLEWLVSWDAVEQSCSPMNDTERRFMRYGHYTGWIQKTKMLRSG